MLTEQQVISAITVLEDGQLQIRRSRRIFDENQMIAETYHRHVRAPGDDTTQDDTRVRALASVLWTPAVIQAYRDAQLRNRIQ